MRAKLPVQDGLVDRDGVKLYYEVYGNGPQTMVFVPPWSIVHSRVYKAQLPYFSERFRCVAYDGRGNGKSYRPADVAAYSLDNYVADLPSVMDATGTEKAIVMGFRWRHDCGRGVAHHPGASRRPSWSEPQRHQANYLHGSGSHFWPGGDVRRLEPCSRSIG
jgi:hypothetical protein